MLAAFGRSWPDTDKNEAVVWYALPKGNTQIFASRR
jgi:hypothetical protein